MGFDMMMIWSTTYDKETGKPRQTTPPDVPEEHRPFLHLHDWFYSNFIPEHCETHMSASALFDCLDEWDEIDWEAMRLDYEEDDYTTAHYKEEYEGWRKAMEWFGDNGFDAVWWW